QRFRVYQRRGYYRPGLEADRDAYDKAATNFLAVLRDEAHSAWLLGSARLIRGEARPGFRFPAEQAFEFTLPPAIADTTVSQRVEVTPRGGRGGAGCRDRRPPHATWPHPGDRRVR